MLCQPSMATATISTAALKSSCPAPWKREARRPANTATRQAPRAPAASPRAIQRPRRGTPLLEARTTPTTRPASRISRKTITALASIDTSLGDHHAPSRVLVILAGERVASLLEGPNADG